MAYHGAMADQHQPGGPPSVPAGQSPVPPPPPPPPSLATGDSTAEIPVAGQPIVDPYGRVVTDQYGRPISDLQAHLVTDEFGRVLTDEFGRPLVEPNSVATDRHRALRRRWPTAAKVVVAILSVLVLAGTVGTIVGLARSSSANDDADSSARQIELLRERATDAEAELIELEESTSTRITELTAERDTALADLEQARAAAGASESALTEELAEANARIEELTAQLEEIGVVFPVAIAPDLGVLSIDGNYRAQLTQVGCTALSVCDRPPALPTVSMARRGNQISMNVPGFAEVQLVVINGQLYGSTSSVAFVEPCDGVQRDAQLVITMFADQGELATDGTLTVNGLGATIIVDAAATGDCERARVWWSAQLTRLS